jgi:hypothetical protein
MWGQISGVNKTVMLRDALKRSFTQFNGRLNAGLLVFGAAKSAGCDDIQTLKPIAPIDESYGAALDLVKPKGSGPIAAAIDRAQTLITPAQANSTSITIIADGLDNCKADPCAAANALKARFPGVKINMIAFDARAKETLSGLSCVAEATGGVFVPATNQAELDAAVQQAFTAASRTSAFAGARPGVPSRAALDDPALLPPDAAAEPGQSRPSPPRDGAPGRMSLAAYLSQESPPISTGVKWRIFDGQPGEDGSYKLLQTLSGSQPALDMPPGEYLVNAAYGRANLTKKVAVWPGQTVADGFVLNAGGLRLGALLPNGEAAPDNQVRFEVLSDATDQFGNRERVVENARPGVIIRLNSGYYHVVSIYGDCNARIESDVIIEPGKLTEAIFKQDAAKINFRLVRRAGGEALADTRWTIQTAEGELIKETAGAFPTHILATGRYRVTANHEDQDYIAEFTVTPGEAQQIEVVIAE